MTANYISGDSLYSRWHDDVLTGTGPVVLPHGLPSLTFTPGGVSLLGGAPGAGKTALAMQCVVEALRYTPALKALVANVEMSPEALLDRQLARLSGIEGEVIRHRRFTDEHHSRLDAGLNVVESIIDRLAFLEPPFDLANVAHAADAHGASLIVLDYLQRIMPPGEIADTRLRVNATMDMIRRFASAGCAVVALSAVGRSRDASGRSTYAAGSMSLASFRDSGELEYGADDAYVLAPVDDRDPSVVRLSHLKSRHGAQRSIDLRFDRAHQSFTLIGDADEAKPEPPKKRRRSRAPAVEPEPAFSAENLAALWGSTPAATDDTDDDEAVDE